MTGFTYFEFDLATPLFEQIRECLDAVNDAPLTIDSLENGNDGPGVYMLIHSGTPVYIGKSGDSVVQRLTGHMKTISGRKNITLADISFKTATFARTWNPFLPESHLIDYYNTKQHWNSKGFGSNEPGRRRYTTKYKPDHFLKRYPINEMFICDWITKGRHDARLLCRELQSNLPFWVKVHEQEDILDDTAVHIHTNHPTTIDVIRKIGESLGDGWRVAIIPSHILIQYQANQEYPDMEIIYP